MGRRLGSGNRPYAGPLRDKRQEAFCQNVAQAGMSLRQCAILAGYPPGQASVTAWRLGRRPAILARIVELKAAAPGSGTESQLLSTSGEQGTCSATLAPERAGAHREAVGSDTVSGSHAQKPRAASADEILREVDRLALSDISQAIDLSASFLRFLPINQWPIEIRRAVASIKVREYPVNMPDFEPSEIAALRAYADALEKAPVDSLPAGLRKSRGHVVRAIRKGANAAECRYSIIEIKLWSKPQALAQAGNAHGLFRDLTKLSDAELSRLEDELISRAIERRNSHSRVQKGTL